jgi:DNA oxidative demethylase
MRMEEGTHMHDPASDLVYVEDVLTLDEERNLQQQLVASLELTPLRFRGQWTKRRIASFGLDYRPGVRHLQPAAPIPSFLLDLRRRAAAIAELPAESLEQALVTDYPAQSEIGWHVDQLDFGDTVVAVSMIGRATLRLRTVSDQQIVLTQVLAPRSVYVLRPRYRYDHQHMVHAHEERISVTFRSIAAR